MAKFKTFNEFLETKLDEAFGDKLVDSPAAIERHASSQRSFWAHHITNAYRLVGEMQNAGQAKDQVAYKREAENLEFLLGKIASRVDTNEFNDMLEDPKISGALKHIIKFATRMDNIDQDIVNQLRSSFTGFRNDSINTRRDGNSQFRAIQQNMAKKHVPKMPSLN